MSARPTETKPRRNVELKARIASVERAEAVAAELGARCEGDLNQIDTYFRAREGRLKLREINGDQAELIWYDRPDEAESKLSRYRIVPIGDAANLKASLAVANGVETVVRKRRRLWMLGIVRIHLDSVEALGDFLEFEAVLAGGESVADGQDLLAQLQTAFAIAAEDRLQGSYRELMLQQENEGR